MCVSCFYYFGTFFGTTADLVGSSGSVRTRAQAGFWVLWSVLELRWEFELGMT